MRSKDPEPKENYFKMETIITQLLLIQKYRFRVLILITALKPTLTVFITKHNLSPRMKLIQKILNLILKYL